MATPYTAGPWEWVGYSLRPVNPDPATSAVHTIIDAEHIGWGFVGADPAQTRAESDANMRLIAQAPELVETLRQIAAIAHNDIAHPDHAIARAMIMGMANAAVSSAGGQP